MIQILHLQYFWHYCITVYEIMCSCNAMASVEVNTKVLKVLFVNLKNSEGIELLSVL